MLSDAIVVRDSCTIHGTGLVAARYIAAGEWVWRADPGARRVPCSEVLSWSAERQREFQKVGWQVDADSFEVCDDASRYMNHSCDPNTWWGGEGLLVARRDIAPGEEVTYDYATSELALSPGITCACGCACCREEITNRDWEDPGWQARYAGHLPAHVREAIAARPSSGVTSGPAARGGSEHGQPRTGEWARCADASPRVH